MNFTWTFSTHELCFPLNIFIFVVSKNILINLINYFSKCLSPHGDAAVTVPVVCVSLQRCHQNKEQDVAQTGSVKTAGRKVMRMISTRARTGSSLWMYDNVEHLLHVTMSYKKCRMESTWSWSKHSDIMNGFQTPCSASGK